MARVFQGAEAELFETAYDGRPSILKRRVRKRYRVHALDVKLREERTRREARLLHAAKLAGVRCPLIYHADLLKKELFLEKISGIPLKDALKKGNPRPLMTSAAVALAELHGAGIVHGDFTASNLLVTSRNELVVIDFGLGAFDSSLEAQATDLLLLKKSVLPAAYRSFETAYAKARGRKAKPVLARLAQIEKRGRYVVRAQIR